MKSGSVVVDLAVEAGGNCAHAKFGQVVEKHGVTIIGYANVPGRVAGEASKLFSRNLFNFLSPYFDKETKSFAFEPEDEIIQGTMITKGGVIIHPALKKKPAAKKKTASTKKKAAPIAADTQKSGPKLAKRKTPKKKGA